MRAGAWLSCGEVHGFALGQPRLVPTAQGVLPMSIPPRPFRTVSLARALAFTLIAAPCVYAQSGTPAGGADVATESTQSTRDAAGGELRAAASQGNLAEVERLLKAGADLNAKDKSGTTPLHLAAAKNSTPAVLEVLLKAGADPRAIDSDGKTPHAVARPEYRDILWKAMMDKPLR